MRIVVRGNQHFSHRLAWLWMTGAWPEDEIDHKNRDHSDNRWDNLRVASRRQNEANKVARCRSGIKHIRKRQRKWEADIVFGEHRYREMFDCPAAAQMYAYVKVVELYGEFACV